jgi:hypothetical protein
MDYSYPSVFLSYFLFLILTLLTLFFLIHSRKHGYFGKHSEDPVARMMNDDDEGGSHGR